jgi:putative ABC transport system permease protein
VGKRIKGNSSTQPWTTVVGVVGDVHHFGLDHEVRPEWYISFLQGPPNTPLLALRTAGDPAAMAATVRAELRRIEPELVMYNFAPLEELLAGSMASRRHTLGLIGLFALISLALAAVGIYGVLAYGVTQRLREMAVRMALGARPADVLRLVVGEGMAMVAAGAVLGLIASVALARFLTGLLYGVSPLDLSSYAASVVLLVLVALLACYLPARRATRVDPVTALRHE